MTDWNVNGLDCGLSDWVREGEWIECFKWKMEWNKNGFVGGLRDWVDRKVGGLSDGWIGNGIEDWFEGKGDGLEGG